MGDIFDTITSEKKDVFDKVGNTFMKKVLDFASMGHLYGEYGPEKEVSFTPEGKMIKAEIPTGDPGFLQDPITALGMGAGAGLKAAGTVANKALVAGREALGWLTGGASEVPALAKAGVKGAVKVAESKPLAEAIEARQARGVLESVTPEAKVTGDVFDNIAQEAASIAPKVAANSIPDGSIKQLETEVKGGLPAGNLPKYAEGSAINLERIDTTDDIKNFLNQRTKQLEETIGKRKVSWEETRAEAEKLGWNIAEAKKAFNKKGSFSSAEVDAMRQLNTNAVSDFFEKIKNLPADRSGYTPELRAEYLDLIDSIKTTSQMSSEAGRALNIHKKVLSNDPQFTDISNKERILKVLSGKGVGRTDDILDALKNIDTGNIADVNRFINSVTKTPWQKLTDGAYELWLNGILSNPLTHIRNVTSNALTLAYTGAERTVAAGVEAVRAAITKTPKEMYLTESGQDVLSFWGGLQNGFQRFNKAMQYGGAADKLDVPVSSLPNSVAKYLPTRALMAEDAFFKGFIEHTELNRLAYRKAVSEGTKPSELADRMSEILANPTQDMLEKATARGKYLTYQKELGEIGKNVMRLRDSVPGLKFFIPFVKTPMNIAKFGLERTPLNFVPVINKAIKGELKGAELSEELAKPLIGTMVAIGAYTLAEQGKLTGGMPKNKAEREEKLNTGWQPYSRKIGDKYISYGYMEPVGSIVGLIADFNALEKEMTKEESYNVAAGIMGAIKNNVTDKTFMQGASNLIEAMEDPGRYGSNVSKRLVGSLVPSVSAGIARSIDPYVRDTRTILDNVKARTVGLSDTVEKKLTIWGDPIERQGTAVGRFLNPMPISEAKGSPIEKEMVKLDLNIGYPSRKIGDVEIDPKDYWDMVEKSGSKAKKILNDVVSNSGWDKLSQQMKAQVISGTVDRLRNAEKEIIKAKYEKQGKTNRIKDILK